MTIFFYKVCEPYGCFSNFSPHPIYLQQTWWQTSEHYYQAQKFADTPAQNLMMQIRCAPIPEVAAALGRNACDKMRADWEFIKVQVMYEAVLTKFSTHREIREVLLSTGTEIIIENSETDSYWGCGANGTGKNQLGKILMQVRTELRGKVEQFLEF
jgi:N-glycosidase YbiA